MTPQTKDAFKQFIALFVERNTGHMDIGRWGRTLAQSTRVRVSLHLGKIPNKLIYLYEEYRQDGIHSWRYELEQDDAVYYFLEEVNPKEKAFAYQVT